MAGEFRRKRRSMSMTQAELASRVGCKQSAVSMFEAGRMSALAHATIERIADILEVCLADFPVVSSEDKSPRVSLKYCPVDGCPSNVPYAVGDELHFAPAMVRAPCEQKTRCSACGEIMQSACPNNECGVGVVEGACCPVCGMDYVTVTFVVAGWQAESWADEQRARIREVREMSRSLGYSKSIA